MSLEEWLAPLAGKFSRWNLPSLRSARRIEYDVRANWKLMFQNYSECYHCLGVHPELSKISPHDSAENDLTDGPFLGGFMRIAKGRSLTMSGKACALGIADSRPPPEKWFAPLAGKFARWNLPSLRSARRIEYDVRANWKLIFQNYSECYHCLGVHPELSKISPHDSAENDLIEGPFLGGFMRIASDKSLTISGHTCALPVGDFGDEDFRFVFYYSIFPNMLMSLHPDYVMVHQLEPQSPERTLILCDWFFHPEALNRVDFRPDDAIEFWDMVNRQDWHVCELSQQGISSRAYVPGPYSARESIPAAWDREYLRHLR